MSIIGGLVGMHHEHKSAGYVRHAELDWCTRHIWAISFSGSLLFWILVGTALYLVL